MRGPLGFITQYKYFQMSDITNVQIAQRHTQKVFICLTVESSSQILFKGTTTTTTVLMSVVQVPVI